MAKSSTTTGYPFSLHAYKVCEEQSYVNLYHFKKIPGISHNKISHNKIY
jgi:hypothetical protein